MKHTKYPTNNLVEPLVLPHAEALRFCRDNVCLRCRIHPTIYGWEGSFAEDRYGMRCPKCKQLIRGSDLIDVKKLEEIDRNRRIGEKQMQDDKEKMTTEQALKDLGF